MISHASCQQSEPRLDWLLRPAIVAVARGGSRAAICRDERSEWLDDWGRCDFRLLGRMRCFIIFLMREFT